MKRAIVGHAQEKFTAVTEEKAKVLIRSLLAPLPDGTPITLVSGRSPMGGIDVWAEEHADRNGNAKLIFPPRGRTWATGFQPRNIQIAQTCDEIDNIVVADLPVGFSGMRFKLCYHCIKYPKLGIPPHVKSGGCWTAHEARKLGKPARWHVI